MKSRQMLCTSSHKWDADSGSTKCPICDKPGERLPVTRGYEIECELGRGGMGIVYKAKQLAANRDVAIKTSSGVKPREEDIRRYRAEANVLAGLSSPNVVTLFDIVVDDEDSPFFVMEYVEGGSLWDRLRVSPLAPRAAAEIVERIARTMHEVHSKRIMHRDLKPENVLIAGSRDQPIDPARVKICDFGLARRLDVSGSLTAAGAIIGTPGYMPPEQFGNGALNGEPNVRADVFGLGAILYACLTNRPPNRRGTNDLETLRYLTQPTISPRSLEPSVPHDLDSVCMKCLEKNPVRRYGTAKEVADDLAFFLEGKPTKARPVGRIGRIVRWAERSPVSATLSGFLLLTALLATSVAGWGIWQRQQRLEQVAAKAEYELARNQVIQARLDEVEDLQRKQNYPAAREKLGEILLLVKESGDEKMQRRVENILQDLDQIRKDEKMVRKLRAASLQQLAGGAERGYDLAGAAAQFREAFEDYGIAPDSISEEELVANLQQSRIRTELITALDEWFSLRHVQFPGKVGVFSRAAARVDADPWRNALRSAFREGGGESVRKLVVDERIKSQPAEYVILATRVLNSSRDHATIRRLLLDALNRYPQNALLHLNLGVAYASELGVPYFEALPQFTAQLLIRNPLSHLLQHRVILEHAKPRRPMYEESIRYFTTAAALNPESVGAHHNLAVVLHKLGRHAEAEASARTTIALRPNHVTAHENLGLCLRQLGRPKEAIAAFRTMLRFAPSNAGAYLNIGQINIEQKDYVEAEKAYHEATKLAPEYEVAHFGRGFALAKLGRITEAKSAYQQATAGGGYDQAHLNLGNLFNREGDSVKAEAEYRSAIEANPSNAQAHSNLGEILATRKLFGEAEVEHRLAVALDPRNSISHFNLGQTLINRGNFKEAIESFRAAVRRDPAYADAHAELGGSLMAAEQRGLPIDASGATQHLEIALRLRPDNPLAKINLGMAYIEQGRFSEALLHIEEGHEIGTRAKWRVNSQRFVQQARRLVDLEKRVADVLDGVEKVESAEELLEFAQLCDFRHDWAAATRFYQRVFHEQPTLRTRGLLRFAAGQSATLAGFGLGRDIRPLPEKGRHSLRRVGHEWLRASVDSWDEALTANAPGSRQQVQSALRFWNRDLGVLRHQASLDRLPKEERDQWNVLFADADRLSRAVGLTK